METSVIASSSFDCGIGSWDLKTGNEQLRFKQCASPSQGLLAVGEKFIAASQLRNASGGSSGSIFFWSWNKPQVEVKSFPVESITALAANSEGTYVVGGGASGVIFLWEVATGKLLKKWHAHYQSVTCLVVSRDDSLLVSGSNDGSVTVWSLIRLFDDQQRQQQERTLYEHKFDEHTMDVNDIVIDYGCCNVLMVSASKDKTCKVWSLSQGKLLTSIIFPSEISALALDPGGSVFYAGGGDSKIYIGALNSSSDYYATQSLGSVSDPRWNPTSRQPVRSFTFGNGRGPVNNIQVVRKTIVGNANEAQSSWKRNVSSLPPPLEKYERKEDDTMDGIVIVYPPPFADVPVYSSYHSAELINEQVKELQQQGSAATEIEMERMKLEYKKSIQMNEQWQKNYENLLHVVMEEELNGDSN